MTKYKVEEIGDHLEIYLNDRAKMGWKLINVLKGVNQQKPGIEYIMNEAGVAWVPYTVIWDVEDVDQD